MDDIKTRLDQLVQDKLQAVKAKHEEKLRENRENFQKYEAGVIATLQIGEYMGKLVDEANQSAISSLGYSLQLVWNEKGYRRQLEQLRQSLANPNVTIPAASNMAMNVILRAANAPIQNPPRPGTPAGSQSLHIVYIAASNAIRVTHRGGQVIVSEFEFGNYTTALANELFRFAELNMKSH